LTGEDEATKEQQDDTYSHVSGVNGEGEHRSDNKEKVARRGKCNSHDPNARPYALVGQNTLSPRHGCSDLSSGVDCPATGNRICTTSPPPSRDVACTCPPWVRTMERTMRDGEIVADSGGTGPSYVGPAGGHPPYGPRKDAPA
jgi:hypothetical protein